MKKKSIKLIYKTCILLVLCGCLSACWKVSEIKIDKESKDYCLFGQGSHWIYQDSATLIIDSIVINKSVYYKFEQEGGGDGGPMCETYSTLISSYLKNNTRDFPVYLTTAGIGSLDEACCLTTDFEVGKVMYYNGQLGSSMQRRNRIILLEEKSSYSLSKITFNDVKVFESEDLNKREIYYWAKHIGLIRKEIYETDSLISVRNLIKYDVKPYKQ